MSVMIKCGTKCCRAVRARWVLPKRSSRGVL